MDARTDQLRAGARQNDDLLYPLARRTAAALRAEVRLLVGDFRFASLMERVALPPERLDADRERERQGLELYKIVHAGNERISGLLPQLLATQNDPPAHEGLCNEAVAALDRMLAEVDGTRWRRHRAVTQK